MSLLPIMILAQQHNQRHLAMVRQNRNLLLPLLPRDPPPPPEPGGSWMVCRPSKLLGFIPWRVYLSLAPPAITPLGVMRFRGWVSRKGQASKFLTFAQASEARGRKDEYVVGSD